MVIREINNEVERISRVLGVEVIVAYYPGL
jgi:hypothetical protein